MNIGIIHLLDGSFSSNNLPVIFESYTGTYWGKTHRPSHFVDTGTFIRHKEYQWLLIKKETGIPKYPGFQETVNSAQ